MPPKTLPGRRNAHQTRNNPSVMSKSMEKPPRRPVLLGVKRYTGMKAGLVEVRITQSKIWIQSPKRVRTTPVLTLLLNKPTNKPVIIHIKKGIK
jgi:hypothetical protein